jgi:hypothetical protein
MSTFHDDGAYWEAVVHTPREDVPALTARTAGQVLMQLASLGHDGTEVTVRWSPGLQPELVTPLGVFRFICDSSGERLVVEQVL